MRRRLVSVPLLVGAMLSAPFVATDKGAPEIQRVGFRFPTSIPEIEYFYQLPPGVGGDVTCFWIAEDVGDVAPPNYLVDSVTVSVERGGEGAFQLSRPTNGWPRGKYRLELNLMGERVLVEPFVIQDG